MEMLYRPMYVSCFELFSLLAIKHCSRVIWQRSKLIHFLLCFLARGRVGSGTVLQDERSRVRIPMTSLDFSIDLTFASSLWPWGRLRL
jgi:hypothetical protein